MTDIFEFEDNRSRRQRVLDQVRPPWSRRRAWNLVCAALAAVPGVRQHVLKTTPLVDHPMFKYYAPRRDPQRRDAGPGI